jgi:collagenase-like PrtC family protease
LAEAVKRAHQLDRPVFFALNEHYYINEQYPLLTKYIDGARHADVDALIVSDYGLMAYLRENDYDVPIHVSTGGTVFNWRALKFYLEEFDAENITLPRHLNLDEIRQILAGKPRIDTTVFVLNSRCINVDGFCTFQHGLAGRKILPMFRNACMLPYNVTAYGNAQDESNRPCIEKAHMLERQKIWEKVHVDDHPCGACALLEFRDMGITSVKIVGRGNPVKRKVKDVMFLKHLLDCLNEENPSRNDFRGKARKLYKQTYKRPCRRHMCYFPEVMQKDQS